MHSETATATRTGRRTTPELRADHVGSLLRPPELLQARDDAAAGKIDAENLRAIEDEAIRRIVAKQEEIGLQSTTDGEFRRASWHMDFIYELDGITKEAGHIAVRFHNEKGDIEFTPAAARRRRARRLEDDLRRRVLVPARHGDDERPEADNPVAEHESHYRGGKAAIDRTSTRRWTRSGPTSRPRTPTRCAGSASSAARTSSSTTRASRT